MTIPLPPEVASRIDACPEFMRKKLLFLRRLIIETAAETDKVGAVSESLKWGEPSYSTRTGTTIRIAWKDTRPRHYAMYFHCRTSLVDTFRELHGSKFNFEGNRAIVFKDDEEIPIAELKQCISLALTYRLVKNLPMPGA